MQRTDDVNGLLALNILKTIGQRAHPIKKYPPHNTMIIKHEYLNYLNLPSTSSASRNHKFLKYPSTSSTQVPQVPIQEPNTKIPAALHPSCSLIVESSLPAASHQVPGSLLCHQQAHHSLVVLHLSIKKYFNLKKSKHISLHPLPRIRHSVHLGGGKMSLSSHPKIYILTFLPFLGSKCLFLRRKKISFKFVIIIIGRTSHTTGH